MIRRASALLALALAASPALATGQITCMTKGGKEANLSLTIGSLPVLAVVNARVDAFGQAWAMNPQSGETEIAVGQAAEDGGRMIVDFVDPNVERILVSVRLQQAQEGGDMALAGTLLVSGHGAVAIVCEGP